MKPSLYKELSFDAIVKALSIAQQNEEFNNYFESQGVQLVGIEGRGIRGDKREGLVLCWRDPLSEEIKHIEINPTVKTKPYEEFAEHLDYETQVRVYEQKTGSKITQKAKNKVTQNFEVLAENVKSKVGDINVLAEEIFD